MNKSTLKHKSNMRAATLFSERLQVIEHKGQVIFLSGRAPNWTSTHPIPVKNVLGIVRGEMLFLSPDNEYMLYSPLTKQVKPTHVKSTGNILAIDSAIGPIELSTTKKKFLVDFLTSNLSHKTASEIPTQDSEASSIPLQHPLDLTFNTTKDTTSFPMNISNNRTTFVRLDLHSKTHTRSNTVDDFHADISTAYDEETHVLIDNSRKRIVIRQAGTMERLGVTAEGTVHQSNIPEKIKEVIPTLKGAFLHGESGAVYVVGEEVAHHGIGYDRRKQIKDDLIVTPIRIQSRGAKKFKKVISIPVRDKQVANFFITDSNDLYVSGSHRLFPELKKSFAIEPPMKLDIPDIGEIDTVLPIQKSTQSKKSRQYTSGLIILGSTGFHLLGGQPGNRYELSQVQQVILSTIKLDPTRVQYLHKSISGILQLLCKSA